MTDLLYCIDRWPGMVFWSKEEPAREEELHKGGIPFNLEIPTGQSDMTAFILAQGKADAKTYKPLTRIF